MAIEDITNPEWVRLAIQEFRRDPEKFMKINRFRVSTKFDLLGDDDERYPPKAILALAHKFIGPKSKPLPNKFYGGEPTNRHLRELGFRVVAKATIRADAALEKAFDPSSVADARKTINRNIKARRGQAMFRNGLIKSYNGRCAISGCGVLDTLEAAHIYPYLGEDTNHPTNGVLLRADLHTLFDLNLIGINPDNMAIYVALKLNGSEYERFRDKILEIPSDGRIPSKKALEKRWEEIIGE